MESCPTCGQTFKNVRTHWGLSSCPVPESEYYECRHDNCNESFATSHKRIKHEDHSVEHTPDTHTACHDCDHRYERISAHWSGSDECEYPELTERQHDIIRGLLMGDGCASYHKSSKNPNIVVACVVPEYLHYLSDEFGRLSGSVVLGVSAEDSAKDNRERGFRPNAHADNYQDIYKWVSFSTPEMWQYRNWYETGKKVWPEDLHLAPLTLTHWFAGDGNNQFDYPSIRLAMNNERENTEKVERYFERAGLPVPDRWHISDTGCNAAWNKDSSEELFEYMEGPVPGYEYKWPPFDKEVIGPTKPRNLSAEFKCRGCGDGFDHKRIRDKHEWSCDLMAEHRAK